MLLLVITLSVMSMALVVDMGFLYVRRQQVHRVADIATFAAVQELPNAALAIQRADQWARQNGYDSADADVTVTVEVDGAARWVDGASGAVVDLDCPRAGYCVRVSIDAGHGWFLGQVLSLSAASVRTAAGAEKVARPRDIVIVLDRSGSQQGGLYPATQNALLALTQSQLLFPGSGSGDDRIGLVSFPNNATAPVLHLPYSWSLSGQPEWLHVSQASGLLYGTPPAAGTFSFTVEVSDGNGPVASRTVTLTAGDGGGPLTIESGTLPDSAVGEWYSQHLVVSGGTPPYTWCPLPLELNESNCGSPPGGLTFTAQSGQVTGAPSSAPGTSTFLLRVKDAAGARVERNVTIQRQARGTTLSIATVELPRATVGVPYAQALAAVGGDVLLTGAFGPSSSSPHACPATPPDPWPSQFEPVLCLPPQTGGSQLGPALRAAIDELRDRGRSGADWHIVVASDGNFLDPPGSQPPDDPLEQAIRAQVCRINPSSHATACAGVTPLTHSIAVHAARTPSSPDRPEYEVAMARIASDTGGAFYDLPTASAAPAQIEALARALNIQLTQ